MINTIVLLTKRNKPWVIRVVIIGMMIGVLPVVGLLTTKVSPLLVIGAIVGLVVAPVVFLNLQIGPVLILLVATATGWYVSKGITPALILTALLAVAWLSQQLVLKHRHKFVRSSVMAPALCFILVAVISLPWGKTMADPFLIDWPGVELIQLAQLAVLVLSPVALILTANLITTKRHLKVLVYVYIGFTTIGILAEFLQLPFQLNLRGLNSTWAVGLLYGQLLFNKKLSKWLRLAFVLVIGVWLYIRFFLGITWLSGWLPVVISMGVITFLRSKKVLLLLLILLLIFIIVFQDWWTEVWAAEYVESGSNRLEKWVFLFEHHSTRGHWFLGTGPFGYALYFMTYFPDSSTSTHSNYIDLFLQLGVVGCAVFAWLLGAIAWVGYKLYASPIKDQFIEGFVPSALGGLVAVLAAMFLGDWFTPFVLNQGLHGFSWTVNSWIFLGALVAVPFILSNEQSGKESLEANS
jgi:hypothetical protein